MNVRDQLDDIINSMDNYTDKRLSIDYTRDTRPKYFNGIFFIDELDILAYMIFMAFFYLIIAIRFFKWYFDKE